MPGRRLIDAFPAEHHGYFRDIPRAFSRREGQWLLIPIHHIFGSEELSACYGAIGELAVKPYVALNLRDAAALHLNQGQEASVSVCGTVQRLPLRLVASLSDGVAGIPAGVDGSAGLDLPAWAKIEPAESRDSAAGIER